MPGRICAPAPCPAIVSVTRMDASGRPAMSLWYDRMRSACARATPLAASTSSGASHRRRITPDTSAVPVHRLRREGRHAHRDVLRTLRLGVRAGLLAGDGARSEEHTSELQSRLHLVCRLL